MGWHIRGEMGGVWAHPIKLLDGYWFRLGDTWLPKASRFTTGAGYVQMRFPNTEGLEVTRTEFAPNRSPVALVGLTLRNPGSTSRSVKLTMDARSEIMAAYPWGWTTPNAKEFNRQDVGSYDDSTDTLVFKESGKPWYATIGASVEPDKGGVSSDFWGPVRGTERDEYLEYGNGTGGRMRWDLSVGGGKERTLWVAVAGSQSSKAEATSALNSVLNDPAGLLTQKVNSRLALLNKTQVNLPDQVLQAAFDWGKLNMADLRITVKDMKVRDVDEGNRYPPPVKTIPSATGIGAGFPDYP